MGAGRFAAQLLSGPPAGSAVEVVERLLAVQGQDARGARLAIRARTAGLTAADVDRALTVDRSLVITWLNRGTLHLVRGEDYWWLQDLTTPPLHSGCARRLRQEGVGPQDAERAVAVIERALTRDGPLTRGQLRDRVRAVGVRTDGQALIHLLFLTALRQITVRGPMIGGEQAFVHVHDWLGPAPAPVDRDSALAELARRYLAGHGPATDRDLAKWAGLPLRDATRGLAAIAATLAHGPDGLVELATAAPPIAGGAAGAAGATTGAAAAPGSVAASVAGEPPAPRLLGPYDPLLMGWASREPILGTYREIVTVNGLFRPFALVDGRAVGTWRLAGGKVELSLFEPVDPDAAAALDADAADIRRFLAVAPVIAAAPE